MERRLSVLFSTVFIVLTLSNASVASVTEAGDWRLGLLAGQVGLLGDVSNDDPNTVGYGLTAGYYIAENLILEGSFLASSYTSVDHNELSFGANYLIGDYAVAYPSLSVGAALINNTIKSVGVSGDAFALYVGGGFDFEINPASSLGIQARYQKAFEGKTRVDGQDVATVDDSFSVLIRFLYQFDGDSAE